MFPTFSHVTMENSQVMVEIARTKANESADFFASYGRITRGSWAAARLGADMNSRGRACLTSHLDRLRSKLRCHGLDVGTILLSGRSAQGYMLFPVDDTYGIDR